MMQEVVADVRRETVFNLQIHEVREKIHRVVVIWQAYQAIHPLFYPNPTDFPGVEPLSEEDGTFMFYKTGTTRYCR